jgi:hypothetical protein
MNVKITRRVPKSHAWFENHIRACCIAASQNPIRIFWWSYVNFSCFVLKSHASCWNSTCVCVNNTHTCQNHTLRVEITIVRESASQWGESLSHLCVPKAHCVWKLNSAYWNHTLHKKIALCVYKSHSACWNYSRECRNYNFRVKFTLRVATTLSL